MKPVPKSFITKLVALQPLAAAALLRMNREVVVREERDVPDHYCRKCKQSYPWTDEFFYRTSNGLHSPCKACILEQKQQASAVNPCAVKGCTNPRHQFKTGRYTAYCSHHLREKWRASAAARRGQEPML